MTLIDWIGFVGVTILLIAFFLNTFEIIHSESFLYLFLNLVGAGISCFASYLLKYIPFIIMEGAWVLVSAVGLVMYFTKWRKDEITDKEYIE
jgi:hypothetical protein